jgi:hypothetical protein
MQFAADVELRTSWKSLPAEPACREGEGRQIAYRCADGILKIQNWYPTMRVKQLELRLAWRGMLRAVMLPHQSRDGVHVKAAPSILERHPLSFIRGSSREQRSSSPAFNKLGFTNCTVYILSRRSSTS